MIKIVIVEDDPNHSDRLIKLLQQTGEPIEISAIARNIDDAFEAINRLEPTLIFLDIQLERGEIGFDLLDRFKSLNFAVIFTTSFISTDNTIRAIRACALDFLPKPLMLPELTAAIERFWDNKNTRIEQVETLKKNLRSEQPKEIWIPDRKGAIRIEIKNIMYCKSDNTSTDFYILDNTGKEKKETSTRSIGEWASILEPLRICRIHRSYLANIDYIDRYIDGKVGTVVLKDGTNLPVSDGRKGNLKKYIKN